MPNYPARLGLDQALLAEEDRNFDAFSKRLFEYLAFHPNKHALMRNGEVIEFYSNYQDAHKTGKRFFDDRLFSVHTVTYIPQTKQGETAIKPSDEALRAEVDANYEAFIKRLDEYMAICPGQHALMRHGEVVEFYRDFNDAYKTGAKFFADGLFSVQPVTDRPVYLRCFSHFKLVLQRFPP